jgi:hypothetical protein
MRANKNVGPINQWDRSGGATISTKRARRWLARLVEHVAHLVGSLNGIGMIGTGIH